MAEWEAAILKTNSDSYKCTETLEHSTTFLLESFKF